MSTTRARLRIILPLTGLLMAYLFFWPVSIEPEAWNPPTPPTLTGQYASNEALLQARLHSTLPFGQGPEDIAMDSLGRIYVGLVNGDLIRYDADDIASLLLNTGGRPLGLAWDSLGRLLIADAHKGLLRMDMEGALTSLSTSAAGIPFGFADDLDVAADGKVYFSDASFKHPVERYQDDLMEHAPNGRLMVYDPDQGESTVLLDGLYFANGIAVSPKQDYVLVVETGAYRIQRYWLQGPKAGKAEMFIENLPGFPDGVSADPSGIFWIAMANPRNATLDALLPFPLLRKVVQRLPEFMKPGPVRYGMVLGVNDAGQIVANLQDPAGRFAPVTSVEAVGDQLFLGSLSDTAWAVISRPDGI